MVGGSTLFQFYSAILMFHEKRPGQQHQRDKVLERIEFPCHHAFKAKALFAKPEALFYRPAIHVGMDQLRP